MKIKNDRDAFVHSGYSIPCQFIRESEILLYYNFYFYYGQIKHYSSKITFAVALSIFGIVFPTYFSKEPIGIPAYGNYEKKELPSLSC